MEGKGIYRGVWQNKDKDAEGKDKGKDGKGKDGKGKGKGEGKGKGNCKGGEGKDGKYGKDGKGECKDGKGEGKDGNVKDGEGEHSKKMIRVGRAANEAAAVNLWTRGKRISAIKASNASEGRGSPEAQPKASKGSKASECRNQGKDAESEGKGGPPALQGASKASKEDAENEAKRMEKIAAALNRMKKFSVIEQDQEKEAIRKRNLARADGELRKLTAAGQDKISDNLEEKLAALHDTMTNVVNGPNDEHSSLSGYVEDRPSLAVPPWRRNVKERREKEEEKLQRTQGSIRFPDPVPGTSSDVIPPRLRAILDAKKRAKAEDAIKAHESLHERHAKRAYPRPPEGRPPALHGGPIRALKRALKQ